MLKNKESFELFTPESVGACRPDFVVGKHSGNASLKDFCSRHGISADDDLCALLLGRVKSEARHKKRALRPEEVVALAAISAAAREKEEL